MSALLDTVKQAIPEMLREQGKIYPHLLYMDKGLGKAALGLTHPSPGRGLRVAA